MLPIPKLAEEGRRERFYERYASVGVEQATGLPKTVRKRYASTNF